MRRKNRIFTYFKYFLLICFVCLICWTLFLYTQTRLPCFQLLSHVIVSAELAALCKPQLYVHSLRWAFSTSTTGFGNKNLNTSTLSLRFCFVASIPEPTSGSSGVGGGGVACCLRCYWGRLETTPVINPDFPAALRTEHLPTCSPLKI